MSEIPSQLQNELRKRVATGSYDSIEELLRQALSALDREDQLEQLLIEAVESESDEKLSQPHWDAIREEGLDRLKRGPSQ